MGTTANKALRYPSSSDAPDGPGAFFNLASDVDAAVTWATDLGGADWNTVTKGGTYLGGGSSSHSPSAAAGVYYYLTVITAGSSADVVQVAYGISSSNRGIWFRVRQSGTWLAWHAVYSDSGWAFGSNFSLASGWSTLVDPNGVGSGTSLAGGIRLVESQLELRFRVNRTGATLTADPSGNLADTLVCTVNTAAYQPTSAIYDNFYVIGVRQGTVRLGTDGAVTITDMVPNGTVSTGDTIQVGIRGFVD